MSKNTSDTEKALLEQPRIWSKIARSELPPEVKKILTLKPGRKVYWIGLGSSFHAALWADWTLKLRNKKMQSEALTTWDALKLDLAKRDSQGLYILISHRGLSGLTKKLWAKLGSAQKILISANDPSGNPKPHLVTSEREKSNAHTKSFFGALAHADRICAALSKKRTVDVSQLWSDLTLHCASMKSPFRLQDGACFVGAGPYYAIARELALKAEEMLYFQAHGHDLETFLHGPFAALDSSSQVVALGTAFADLRGEALNKGLNAIGCAKASKLFKDSLSKAPGKRTPPEHDALRALILGQWICLREAERMGTNPDSNRKHESKYRRAFDLVSC